MPSIVLPSNVEAERVVLGSMLLDETAAKLAINSLTEDDFSRVDPRNVEIFKAMKALDEQEKPIDPQTVMNELIYLKTDKSSGGNAYIYELINAIINPDNIEYYIAMVQEQSVLRQLLRKTDEIQKTYAKGVANIADFIVKSNDEISAIASKRSVKGMRSAGEVALEVKRNIEKVRKSDRNILGITTGYRQLDQMTLGWQKGNMIILAARPSVGKTALGMNFAYNAAHRDHVPVAFFSLEMPAEKIMERLIASRSYINGEKIQTGRIYTSDIVKVSEAVDEISKTQLYFDDTPNSRLSDIIAKARKLKNKVPDLGLIVIDYLGRIRHFEKADASARQQEVSLISGELKTLARNLDVPIIVLCQLNRNTESGENKVPELSNLRESGSIEQDADIVLLLYRADYYTDLGQKVKTKKHGQDNGKKDDSPSQELTPEQKEKSGDISEVQVLVAKNRNGKTGKCTLLFQKAYSRFDEPSAEYEMKSRNYDEGDDDE